jgi:hypothetical protein
VMIGKIFSPPEFALAMLLVSAPLGHAPARHMDHSHSSAPGDGAGSITRELPCCGGSVAQLMSPRGQESATSLEGGWRLLRTPDPRGGGRESIAVSHTADLLRSDPEFAGMMLRCSGSEIDVWFVLVEPLPPRSRPQVTIDFEAKTVRFEATVVPPGASIRLPSEATALAAGVWQSVRELSVVIETGEGGKIKGVVPLEGLRTAYTMLAAACKSSN